MSDLFVFYHSHKETGLIYVQCIIVIRSEGKPFIEYV